MLDDGAVRIKLASRVRRRTIKKANEIPGKGDGESVTNLLWTGGWDSTFRLLWLVVVLRSAVRAWYLIDGDRISTFEEIKTIDKIKKMILAKYPWSRELLAPVEFKLISEIKPNQRVTDKFKALLLIDSKLGGQYEWLARFAEESGLPYLEMSAQRDSVPNCPGSVPNLIEPYVVKRSDGADGYYELVENPENPNVDIFRGFRFPLFNLTKLEMQELAQEYGFTDIMEQTWFCNSQLADGSACGTCSPCSYLMKEGFSKRIPLRGRMRYHIKRLMPSAVIRFVRKHRIVARKQDRR
jgi:7-cyano-7-deazaguanine synthase in queuosine biosynthesis